MPRFIIRQKAQSSHGDVPSASLAFFLQQDSSSLLKPNTSLGLCITLLLSDGFHADEHEEGSVLGEQEVEEDETEQRGEKTRVATKAHFVVYTIEGGASSCPSRTSTVPSFGSCSGSRRTSSGTIATDPSPSPATPTSWSAWWSSSDGNHRRPPVRVKSCGAPPCMRSLLLEL
ncbi:hypothetical protein HPP92_020612 [Vanilla planifolia]|uniref:Uncharacterized protein n=1 Tax=Vanilla planifolia TaxID=51239 RepID=A0A835Q107_VANPL|nr:hypothetical protein HPP92_021051 [Vanilla planifolia]KAG0462136.1 hypothetical protein HPP92_020612 [Vanilla planifolia]